ncbi:DUF2163 domain-containing protein [Tardiphaga sp. 619_E2_N8_5]|uniref:DUF2163 domain-containing protein n=1 Tax=unclassified Tardiphaga TaxID=2631404 RepID=UPI003F23D138
MRSIPPALQARLDSGVTTLAQVWKLTRRDGVIAGFTDHDCDLVIGGVTYRAGTGLAASEATSRFDLSVDGGDIAGALDDDILTDADLAAGRYDAAQVETWLVDWSDTSLRVLTARGTLGEVKREGSAFIAELRGLAALLSQESGRLYTARCSADLGDGKCRINLAGWQGTGAVEALEGVSMFSASGLGAFADDLFTAGRLTWTSGGNAGLAMEVKQHRVTPGHVRLSLWQAMAEPIAIGDAFTVTAGCDKTLATCRDRFGNVDNFRGFPDIPGNDFVMSYPTPGMGGG